MSQAWKTVRVFISSTFRDMHAERDHLVTVVFPELRERVERLGLEFFDVDLRWGVPAKDANGETANSWEYCKKWIDRVEPFFVSLLGQRYGFVPEPQQIRDEADRHAYTTLSITEMEIRHAVLVGRIRRRSFFYLRQTRVPDQADTAAKAEFVEDEAKVERLKALIKSGPRPVREYPCAWTGAGFSNLEVFGRQVLEDLWSGVLRDERYVSKDVWHQALGGDPDRDPRYTDESAPVPEDIAAKIVALAKPLPKDPLDAEREQMQAFAASRLRWFQGRTRELQQLADFIASTDETAPRLAIIAAAPGQGKSALLAKLAELLLRPEVSPVDGGTASEPTAYSLQSSAFLITHFVGATERSASAHALVERLLDELEHKDNGIEWPKKETPEGQPKEEAKLDFNSLCFRLAGRLGDYGGERRIVILLDALNQLSDGHDLNWLPNRLGPSVRVIVSCIEDASGISDFRLPIAELKENLTPEQRVLRALSLRQPAPLRVSLGPLTEDDVRTIVVAYLKEYCHELDREHLDTLSAIPQARNPLYLLVMLNELRTLGGNDLNRIVPTLIASMPHDHPDTVSLFRWVLQRMEVFGAEAVRWWCLYLAHGRVGMASHELADLLARKLGADAAAMALRIERGLRRYLQRRGLQLDFFHGQLRQAVMEHYGPHAGATSVHGEMADYFRDLADPENNQSWKGDSPRPFLQVVFHLVRAERTDDYCQTLCDLRFVEARCRVGQVFELIADYRLSQENLPERHADMRDERERQERIARWTADLIAYAQAWSARRDQTSTAGATSLLSSPEPQLPIPPPTCRMWTEEEIQAEWLDFNIRNMQTPTRRDRLEGFASFVSGQCYPLLEHGQRPGFVLQHGFNTEPGGAVHDAAGLLLAASTEPHLLRRWPPGTFLPNPKPAILRTLTGHSASVRSVSVTPDGRRAVSGGDDNTLRVWDLESGQCLRTLEGHAGPVCCVSMTPDGRRTISGSKDQTVRVWDLESGTCLWTLTGHSDWVLSVSVTPDGRMAVSGSGGREVKGDYTVRVWDLASGQCLQTLTGHRDWVESVSVTPDGRQAVSGSRDTTVRVWDLESGQCLRILTGHKGGVRNVSMTPDGRRVVSGSGDETMRVWDLKSAECRWTLTGHKDTVESVNVTPDGRWAVSGSYDKTMRIWDMESGQCLRTLPGHSGSVESVSVTSDGRRAVSVSTDGTVRVWNLESGRCPRSLEGNRCKGVDGVGVSPDGRWAVTGSGEGMVRVWDLGSGQCLREMGWWHMDGVSSVSVTPDGRRAVSGSLDKTVRVWDLTSGQILQTLAGQGGRVFSVSVTPDGRRAVSGGDDNTLRVWDLESGQCLRTFTGYSGRSVSVTPDGQRAVSGSSDHTLRVWDLESGACLRTLEGHSGLVSSVSVTPDGQRAVFGSYDHTLRVWDLENGACLRTLEGYSGLVSSVSVTADGRRAVSGSLDKTLRAWDLASGRCLGVYPGSAPFSSVARHGAGNVICTVPATGEVLFLELHGVLSGPAILTAAHPQHARCPACGQEFAPPPAVVAAMQERSQRSEVRGQLGELPSFDLPTSAFADARLFSACPHCQHPLQFNPFFSAAEDYADVLCRGLEFSRREKGPDHEETLAHLTALAVHLEANGKSEEAAEFRREHDEIAARVAARKKD